MAFVLGKMWIAILMFITRLYTASGWCSTLTHYARPNVQRTISHQYYSNNERCKFVITPSYTTNYYLEIKWTLFDVNGNMPNCADYVEVFLTSSRKSIGRYCSGNIKSWTLFNMYSHDGYATILFVSDNYNTNRGFSLTYTLKAKSTSALGGAPASSCPVSIANSSAGNYYSVGWPSGYRSTRTDCSFIYTPGKNKMKIAVMDLDFAPMCQSSSKFLDIRESESYYTILDYIRYFGSRISDKLCGTLSPTSYSSTKSNVYFYYGGTGSSMLWHRGFVIGYIEYGDEIKTTTSNGLWSRWSHVNRPVLDVERHRTKYMVVGLSIGSVFFIVSAIAITFGLYHVFCKPKSTPVNATTSLAYPSVTFSSCPDQPPFQANQSFVNHQESEQF